MWEYAQYMAYRMILSDLLITGRAPIRAGTTVDTALVELPAEAPSMAYDSTSMDAAIAVYQRLRAQLGEERAPGVLSVLWGLGALGGSYTPTFVGVTNVDGTALVAASWVRSGDVVRVDIELDVDPTAAAATEVGVELPVASAIASAGDVSGIASGGSGVVGFVAGDAANDRAALSFTAGGTAAERWRASFSYSIR